MVNNANICRMPTFECIPKNRRQRYFSLQKLRVPPVSPLPLPSKTGLTERVENKTLPQHTSVCEHFKAVWNLAIVRYLHF